MIDWTNPEKHPYYPLDPLAFPRLERKGVCHTCGNPEKDHTGKPEDYITEFTVEEFEVQRDRIYSYVDPRKLLPHPQVVLTSLAELEQPIEWRDVLNVYGYGAEDKPKSKQTARGAATAVLGYLIDAGCIKVIEKGSYQVIQDGPLEGNERG